MTYSLFNKLTHSIIVLLLLFIGNINIVQAQTWSHKKAKKTSTENMMASNIVFKKTRNVEPFERGVIQTAKSNKNELKRDRHTNYRYQNGKFYSLPSSKEAVVRPPIGAHVDALPPIPFRAIFRSQSYFYYDGRFYQSLRSGGYMVVAPPIGTILGDIADDYEIFTIDGTVYYVVGDIYFKRIVERNGNDFYEVVRVG